MKIVQLTARIGQAAIAAAAIILLITNAVAAAMREPVSAMSVNDFLNSIGTLSAISVRGENLEKTIECTRYLGVRWLRAGIEGNVPIQQFVDLHRQVHCLAGQSCFDKQCFSGKLSARRPEYFYAGLLGAKTCSGGVWQPGGGALAAASLFFRQERKD